jgi:hypothetical protein
MGQIHIWSDLILIMIHLSEHIFIVLVVGLFWYYDNYHQVQIKYGRYVFVLLQS